MVEGSDLCVSLCHNARDSNARILCVMSFVMTPYECDGNGEKFL